MIGDTPWREPPKGPLRARTAQRPIDETPLFGQERAAKDREADAAQGGIGDSAKAMSQAMSTKANTILLAAADNQADGRAPAEGAAVAPPEQLNAVDKVLQESQSSQAATSQTVVEVYVPGLNFDFYGDRIEVEFVRKLRDERAFPSKEALVRQIREDVASLGPPS